MKHHRVVRTALGAVASAAVLLPLAACSGDRGENEPSSTVPEQSSPAPGAGPSEPAAGPEESAAESPEPGGQEYRDGTYTARGVYGGAPSYMDFTIVLDDGAITEVESELMADNNDTSRGYQERFAADLPDEVVGQSIDDLEVGVIAGASGCGDGFNDALDKIRAQAAIG